MAIRYGRNLRRSSYQFAWVERENVPPARGRLVIELHYQVVQGGK